MSALVVLLIALLIQSIVCDKFDPTTHRAWHLVNDESCGIRTQQRTVGGSDAGIGEFPWVVNIFFEKLDEEALTVCTGGIISKKFVLTAAHCQPPNHTYTATVLAGELDTSRDPDCDTDNFCPPSPKHFKVEKFIPNRIYDPWFGDDIALVKIEGEFEFDGYIAPLCLEYGPLLDEDYAGDEAEFAGWGAYKIDPVTFEGTGPSVLQKITMPVQDAEGCYQELEYLTLFFHHETFQPEAFLCAGGRPGQHIYYGDSGGVLAIARSVGDDIPRFFGIGICALVRDKKYFDPSVDGFQRVSFYLEWILDTIADESGI